MSEQFRMFISLPVPDTVKEELRRLQHELRAHLPDDAVRWTRPEQVHLTLKFLGNVPVEQVEELAGAMRAVCGEFSPIAMRAEKLGFFPPRGVPRVLWVSVRDEREELLRLQRGGDSTGTRVLGGRGGERFTRG